MHTFEITVQRKAQNGSGETPHSGRSPYWPVVAEHVAPGSFLPIRDEGKLQLDPAEVRSQATPRDYGTAQGKALFREHVRDAFVAAFANKGEPLHVLLFVEDPELRELHWERLCAPFEGRWDHLGLNQQTPFSLYLPSVTDRRFPPIGRRDLRALILVADPEGLDHYRLSPFDAAAAVRGVRAALGPIPSHVLGKVAGAVGPPTLDALCERVTAERYSLLHLVCHGRYHERETVLYLARPDNTVDPVTGKRFLERLCQLTVRLPQFAFLSTCQSAVPAAWEALGGLAQRMVHEPGLGMPAVLAMSESVTTETALKLAEAFYRRLHRHGAVDLALAEACAGLAGRPDVTVPVLYSRLGGRPLFSDTLDRPLTNAEIEYGLGRVRELLAGRAPVWLARQPGEERSLLDRQESWLRETLYAEYADLGGEKQRDRERALDEVSNLCDEALERSFAELALGKEPPAYDERCPFRGLYPFRVKDREFFFGREVLVAKLEGRLAETGFLAVLGSSGCGKSSLVLAGLVPALQEKEPAFELAYLTPTSEPVAALDACLEVNRNASLLVVDQFEELFTLCADERKRREFLDRLLERCGQVRVVVAMRADFWGECAPYPDLKGRMQANQELVAPMDTAELRRAIEMQAGKVGLRFEADLGQTIREEVQGEPGAMPLLQHALRALWNRRHGRWLRAEEYRAVGGARKAIAETAEAVYRELPAHEKEWMRNIFLRLTRLDVDTARAEERRDTRQRVWLEELVPVGADPAALKALVNRLAGARLVVTSVSATTGREEVEVGHEALIRHWDRLRQWLEEDRATLRLREGLRRAAREWLDKHEEESFLAHRGAALEEAVKLREHSRFGLSDLERKYVEACVEQRDREQRERERRQKWVIASLLVGLAVATGLSVAFLVQKWRADGEAQRATKQEGIAKERQGELEGALARTWLRPLSLEGGPLTEMEIGALTELAGTGDQRLADRFIEEALRERQGIRRLRTRSEYALHATVGLNLQKREEVERRLLERLAAPDLPDDSRSDLALAAAALGELSPSAAATAGRVLARGMALEKDSIRQNPREMDTRRLEALVEGLAAVATRMEPREAAPALVKALGEATRLDERRAVAQRLAAVAARMEPEDAAAVAAALVKDLRKATGRYARVALAEGLAAVAVGMEPRQASRACAEAAPALVKDLSGDAERALAAVAARMEPEDAAAVAAAFVKDLGDADTYRQALAAGLAAVAARMEPRQASRVCAEAAHTLVKALVEETRPEARGALAEGLAAVAVGMEPRQASRACAEAAPALVKDLSGDAERALAAVAARMEPKDAAAVAAALVKDLGKKIDPYERRALAAGLAAVAARMEPREASRACAEAAPALVKARGEAIFEDARRALAEGLAAVAARMEPKDAAAVAAALVKDLRKATGRYARGALAEGLAAVAARMEPHEAVLILLDALVEATDPDALQRLAEGLAAVAARMEPREASQVCAAVAAALVKDLVEETDPYVLQRLAEGLAAVAARMEPRQASRVCAEAAPALVKALGKATHPDALRRLAEGLAAVAARMEPRQASRVCARTAGTLAQALSCCKETEPHLREALARAMVRAMVRTLTGIPPTRNSLTAATAVTSLASASTVPATLALLCLTIAPPCRLSDEELVDLLKHPLFVGEARRVVLDQLGNRYGRKFIDQWAFVRFAQEQNLGLDFTSPSQRLSRLAEVPR